MIVEEFFARKGLRALGTISGDDVLRKARLHFVAVRAFFLKFMEVIDVGSQINLASKQFRAARTLFIFGQMLALEMVFKVDFCWGFVVAKSAAEFFSMFFIVVDFSILFAFEKGETVQIFAPDGFLGMVRLDVIKVAFFIPDDFLAIKTLNGFSMFLNFFVRFFFVFLQVVLSFEK